MEKQTVTQNLSCVWEPLKQTVKGERWIATVHRSSIQMRRRVEADASAKSVVSDQGSACRILLMSMWASVPGRGGGGDSCGDIVDCLVPHRKQAFCGESLHSTYL